MKEQLDKLYDLLNTVDELNPWRVRERINEALGIVELLKKWPEPTKEQPKLTDDKKRALCYEWANEEVGEKNENNRDEWYTSWGRFDAILDFLEERVHLSTSVNEQNDAIDKNH